MALHYLHTVATVFTPMFSSFSVLFASEAIGPPSLTCLCNHFTTSRCEMMLLGPCYEKQTANSNHEHYDTLNARTEAKRNKYAKQEIALTASVNTAPRFVPSAK
jgi:hypothetical protein